MNRLQPGVPIGDRRWRMAVVIATAATLVVVISIGLASFIDRFNPVAIEALAVAMLVTLCLTSVYVVARVLSERS